MHHPRPHQQQRQQSTTSNNTNRRLNNRTTSDPPQGYPIFVERLGQLDAKRIEKEKLSDEQLLAYHRVEMQFMIEVGGVI